MRDAEAFFADLLAPLRPPRHPLLLGRFGLSAIRSAAGLGRSRFEGERARALLAGCSAHSMLSLRAPVSAAFGIVLAVSAHAVGWPVARGGSQRLADALAAHLRSLGGSVETGHTVDSLAELDGRSPALLDVTPRQLLALAGDRLPDRYRRALGRYRYGPGVFKLDWALAGPIPWTASEAARAGTVHLGGHAGRDRRRRAHRGPRRAPGAAVRAAGPAEPVRRNARAAGPAHGLGVLPRPERLDARHDRRRSRRRSSASHPVSAT